MIFCFEICHPDSHESGCRTLRQRAPNSLALAPENAPEEPDDVLHVATYVVEHHGDEEQADDEQPALQDALAGLRAESTSLHRLGHVEKDLPSIENRNWQQIEHGDIDA